MKLHAFLCCLSLTFLTACQTTQTEFPERFFLNRWLPIQSMEQLSSFNHTVTFDLNDTEQSLIFQGQVSESKLIMVALSDIGMPLFDISLTGQKFNYQERIQIDLPIRSEWLLESFQLTFWPQEQISAELNKNCSLQVIGSQRKILCDHETQVTIDYIFELDHLKSVKYTSQNPSFVIDIDINE